MFVWKCLFRKGGFHRTIKARRNTRVEIKISASFHKSWMAKQGWAPVVEKLTKEGRMIYLINHKEGTIELPEVDERGDVCQKQKTLQTLWSEMG